MHVTQIEGQGGWHNTSPTWRRSSICFFSYKSCNCAWRSSITACWSTVLQSCVCNDGNLFTYHIHPLTLTFKISYSLITLTFTRSYSLIHTSTLMFTPSIRHTINIKYTPNHTKTIKNTPMAHETHQNTPKTPKHEPS